MAKVRWDGMSDKVLRFSDAEMETNGVCVGLGSKVKNRRASHDLWVATVYTDANITIVNEKVSL